MKEFSFKSLTPQTLAGFWLSVILILGASAAAYNAYSNAQQDNARFQDQQKAINQERAREGAKSAPTSTDPADASTTSTSNNSSNNNNSTGQTYTTYPPSNSAYQASSIPAPYTPPTCDQEMKVSFDAIHSQQLAAETNKNNLALASINAMPTSTEAQIYNKLKAQEAERIRHSSAISGIDSAYYSSLKLINC